MTAIGLGSRPSAGFASGSVRMILRLEGAAAFATAVAVYAHEGFSWPHTTALALPLVIVGALRGHRSCWRLR